MAQKKITDLQLRSDCDETCNFPVDDAVQTWRVTGQQIQDFVVPFTAKGDLLVGDTDGAKAVLPGNTAAVEKMLTQTGTGSASDTPVWREVKAPTVQRFTSGSGTYTTPAGVKWIKVKMIGGGGGGQGSSTNGGQGAGGTGGNSTFGTSLLAANGAAGGTGGTAPTINSPAISLVAVSGGNGADPGKYFNNTVNNQYNMNGGHGAQSPFGGAGYSGSTGTGGAAVANTGSGGGGAGLGVGGTGAMYTGQGGGSGAYLEAIIANPSASYSYAVGAAGSAGSAGTGGAAGSAGGSGVIIVEEYYQ